MKNKRGIYYLLENRNNCIVNLNNCIEVRRIEDDFKYEIMYKISIFNEILDNNLEDESFENVIDINIDINQNVRNIQDEKDVKIFGLDYIYFLLSDDEFNNSTLKVLNFNEAIKWTIKNEFYELFEEEFEENLESAGLKLI